MLIRSFAPALVAALLLSVVLGAPAVARAYEGAVTNPEAPAPETPPPPKLTRAPEVSKFIEAVYPPTALAIGVGAEVHMLVDIDAAGKVSQVAVTSAPNPGFDEAAVAAAEQFEFSPAEVDGKPAAVRIEYVYHFETRPPPQPAATAPVEQPINLRGTVLERGTREPMSTATVYLPQSQQSAATDTQGKFELRGVAPGEVKLEITELAHKKYETTVTVKEGEVTELTAYLWKKVVNGFEVTVRSDRDKPEVSHRTLEKGELTSVPGTYGDPVRVIENMPGMGRVPYGLGLLLVRGAQPQDTSVLLDGMPVPLLYHFVGGPSVIAPGLIDRIDFYPGAYGAKYGRAIAGIVDVSTKPLTAKQMHGAVDISLLNAGFNLETPLGTDAEFGHLALAARRSYVDLLLKVILDATRRPGQAAISIAPYYWDYQGRYDIAFGKDKLSLTAFGSNDSLNVAQSGSTETQSFSLYSQEGFQRGRLSWSRVTDDGWALSLAPSGGITTNGLQVNQQVTSTTTSWDFGLRGAARKELLHGLNIELGVDLNKQYFNTRTETAQPTAPGEETPPPPLVQEHKVNGATYAAYEETVWAPVTAWKLIPGFRVEAYDLPRGTELSLEPRLATRFDVSEQLTLKAAWGIFREGPQPSELDPNSGNPSLGLSQSQQTVAGFEYHLMPNLLLDMQGYYNWRDHLVVNSNAYVVRNGATVPERLNNSGHGRTYGLELLLKRDITEHFYGWLAYTLSRSEQYDPTTRRYLPTLFDETHILTLVASYKLEGWELGGRFRLTTGRPETPVLGATFNADSGRYEPLTGAPDSARGVTFYQLDIRLEKEWTYDTWRFSVYLDVQNVTNAENRELTVWDYRFRQSAPLRGLPILPTLGVTGAF